MIENKEGIAHYQQRNSKGRFTKLNPVHIKHKSEIETYMNRKKNPLSPDLSVSMVAKDARFQHEREKKHELSMEDSLTGLKNRRFVFGDESKPNSSGELRRIYLEAKREGKSLSVLMMDIDLFKIVNDTYGHEAGDSVLRELSEVLKRNIRETDIIARIGGEEFFLILQNTDLDGAKILAEKIRAAVENENLNPEKKENTPNKITISAGVSTFTKGSKKINSETDLFKTADQAMYYAKGAGRNRVWMTDENILDNGEIIFHFHDTLIETKKPSKFKIFLDKLRRKFK